MFKVPNNHRVRKGLMGSDDTVGNQGAFIIPHPRIKDYYLNTIASDGLSWEHVSVSVMGTKRKVERCPTWEEMCFIKDLFWDEGDCVIQYHPPKSEYVNNHKYCLHLWRSTNQIIPFPDSLLVGIK